MVKLHKFRHILGSDYFLQGYIPLVVSPFLYRCDAALTLYMTNSVFALLHFDTF